jgi:hypothetical protein
LKNIGSSWSRSAACALISSVTWLAACTEAGALNAQSSTSPPAAAESTAASLEVRYADVVAIPLRSAGLPLTLPLEQLSVASGEASGLTITEGQIRFITPSDPGTDATVVLRAALPGAVVVVPVIVRSARPTSAFAELEPDEDGKISEKAAQAKLAVTGLGVNNALTGQSLSFSVEGAPPLDQRGSAATLFVLDEGRKVDIAKHWTLDSATNRLIVSAEAMQSVLAQLPSGEMDLDLGLTSADGTMGLAWTILAYKPTATLAGSVVGLDGRPEPAASGRRVAIRGLDNRTRIVATVDESGAFSAASLGAGTYEVSILDTATPNFWTATFAIYPDSTKVTATLAYAPDALKGDSASLNSQREKARISNAASAGSIAAKLISEATQDGTAPMSRPDTGPSRTGKLEATPSTCESAGSVAGESIYTAFADLENVTVNCSILHAIPQGTTEVAVTTSVVTQEHPVFTQSKSKYNDTWSYVVSGLDDVASASGSVNDSHYSQAILTTTRCINVADKARNNSIPFKASLSATNVGDAQLATSTTLEVRLTCPKALTVIKAEVSSPNRRGHRVVNASKPNLPGNYVSVPIVTKVDTWGVPLVIDYEPKDVQITRVRLGIVVNGQPVLSEADLSGSISQRSDGRLQLDDAVIPPIPVTPFPGKTGIVVELSGIQDGQTLTSDAMHGVVQFDGSAAFTPLFLAADEIGSARRYGQGASNPEPGLDSWASFKAISWLKGSSYRFNDISSLHVAQTSSGRSILDHAGHSDGHQLDLRYADGSGGHADALGGSSKGSHIKALLNAAAVEAAASGSGPSVIKAAGWVRGNRALLEKEASVARRLYAGDSWMKLALLEGKFPDGIAIPGVGAWTNRPTELSFIAGHLHHWHMSLKGG